MGLLESLDVYPKKARVSGSKRRVNKTINAGRRRTLLLNVKPARMSVKTQFECPTSDESGPTAMSAKSAFQILTGLTVQQRAKTFFGGTLGETFEAFAIESDRKDRERLLKICNNRLVSLFAERIATFNMTVGRNWIWISRDPAKASRPRDLKIDSGEKSFPLEVANQLARYV